MWMLSMKITIRLESCQHPSHGVRTRHLWWKKDTEAKKSFYYVLQKSISALVGFLITAFLEGERKLLLSGVIQLCGFWWEIGEVKMPFLVWNLHRHLCLYTLMSLQIVLSASKNTAMDYVCLAEMKFSLMSNITKNLIKYLRMDLSFKCLPSFSI